MEPDEVEPTEEQTEEVPEFSDAQKLWLEKQDKKRETEASETVIQTTARLKEELKLEQEKTRKSDLRKIANDKAKADGNTTELLRLKEEEKEVERLEKEGLKLELQRTRDTNTKLALASKYKLPAGYENRLLGSTLVEWEADAAQVAKDLPTTATRPNMDGGNKQTSTKEAQTTSAKRVASNLVSSF